MHVIGYAFVMSLVTAMSDRGTGRSLFEREEGGEVARDEGGRRTTDNDSVVERNGSATRGWDRGVNMAVVLIMYYAFFIMHCFEGKGVDVGEVKDLAAVGEEAVINLQLLVEVGGGAPLQLADDAGFVTEVEGLVAGVYKRLVALGPDEVVGVKVGDAHGGEGDRISDEGRGSGEEWGGVDGAEVGNLRSMMRGWDSLRYFRRRGHRLSSENAAAAEFAGDGGGTSAAEARQGAVRAVEDGGGVVANVVVDAGKRQQLACGRGGGDAVGGDSRSQCNCHGS